ncbi:MAG: L-threonylcarbamoyladenylate synthase [Gammaproteobacteria bacterium]
MAAWHLRIATRILRRGGVIAYPTESVFGLGCVPWARSAVERILVLKRRPQEKGLIVVSSAVEHIEALVDFSGVDRDSIVDSWPGPVTWVLPTGSVVLPWISGRWNSIAIRISAHPVIQALCSRVGPIVSTSANPESKPPARDPLRVRAYFGPAVDLIVPGRTGPLSLPTEIRDARTGAILRKGG